MDRIDIQMKDLDLFLEPLLPLMGRSERRHWGGFYVQGLLLDCKRKTAAGMARAFDGNEQAIQQFVSDSPWDWMPVRRELARRMTNGIRSRHTAWIVDDTCFIKKGNHSACVARQYCGTIGSVTNCQNAISLSFATDEVAFPLDFQLYVPKVWAEDTERRLKAGIPKKITFRRNWQIALEIIDSLKEWQIPEGVVIADAAYGEVSEFRIGLEERGLRYSVGIPRTVSVWTESVDLSRPVHKGKLPKPKKVVDVAWSLPKDCWHNVVWREGSKGLMSSRFARVAVQPARSAKTWGKPEEMQWLIIEWPEGEPEPVKYYLSNLPSSETLKQLVYWARMRWPVEQNYRELKDELGLDHFEGRSWQGWHHHVTLTMMAYDFLIRQGRNARKKGELGLCRKQSVRCN